MASCTAPIASRSPESYLAPFMATNDRKQEIIENVTVLVTNEEITNPLDLNSIPVF